MPVDVGCLERVGGGGALLAVVLDLPLVVSLGVGGIRVLGDERLRLALRALEVVREGVECGGCLVIPVLQRREPIGDLARVLGELVEGIALVLFRVGDRGAQTRDGVVDGIGRRREPRGLGARSWPDRVVPVR